MTDYSRINKHFAMDAANAYEQGVKDGEADRSPNPPSKGRDEIKDYHDGYREGKKRRK